MVARQGVWKLVTTSFGSKGRDERQADGAEVRSDEGGLPAHGTGTGTGTPFFLDRLCRASVHERNAEQSRGPRGQAITTSVVWKCASIVARKADVSNYCGGYVRPDD